MRACWSGKRIGFRVDRMWRAWDWISELWAEKFRAAGASVSFWRSGGRSGDEGERMDRELKEFLKTIDVAVVGLANCGSCTGWTVRDAITAANAGLPTTAIATANFETFAHEIASRGGRSGLRVHVLPYPLNEQLRDDVTRDRRGSFLPAARHDGRAPRREGGRGMTIELIKPGAHRAAPAPKPLVSRDCGPAGCEVDWLASRRHEADLDIEAFTDFAMEMGWGDGLPLVPPTDARVRGFLAKNDRYPDEVIAHLPPMQSECTVEKIAINAVMAGAPPESLELLIAAVTSIADPDFELYGVNATTAPVYPAFVVNGPVRDAAGHSLQLWLSRRRGDQDRRDRAGDPADHAQRRRTGSGRDLADHLRLAGADRRPDHR